MKKLIYTFFCLFFILSLDGQNLVEKFRSESGERWFNLRQLGDRSRGAMTNDFNGNNRQEVIYRDSLFFHFTEFGAGTSKMSFEITSSRIKNNPDDTRFWGPYDIDGNGLAEILHIWDDADIIHLDENTGNASITQTLSNVVGFFDVDGDQLVDLIQYDPATRQTIVLGVPNSDGFAPDPAPENPIKSGNNYNISLKYESDADAIFPYPSNAFYSSDDWDLNGDGIIDIVLIRSDTLGRAQGIRVINGAAKEVRLTYQFQEEDGDIGSDFHGFFDVDGENGKEIYLGKRTVLDRSGNVSMLPEHFCILGFLDIDDDGLKDIIGRDTLQSTIQIWGAASSTPVDEVLLEKIGLHLDPAFPNPMRHFTQIPFQLAQKNRVQLQILSMDGRLIETLMDEVLPAGEHNVKWENDDMPAGTYLYRLRVEEGMVTRRLMKK